MEIKNMPEYAKSKKYIVYRTVGDTNWFYGAWSDLASAERVATEVDGLVMENPDFKS